MAEERPAESLRALARQVAGIYDALSDEARDLEGGQVWTQRRAQELDARVRVMVRHFLSSLSVLPAGK